MPSRVLTTCLAVGREGPVAMGRSTDPYLSPGERAQIEAELKDVETDIEDARVRAEKQQLLALLERSLYLRRHLYSETSPQVVDGCRKLCETCNFVATVMLQQGNIRGAHDLLKRAEQVAEKSDHDRAVTWNNLACYYRRTGKLRTAVSFLERALAIEEHNQNADAAQTHLNLCATLSQLNRHDEALSHARCALLRNFELLSPLMLRGELSIARSESVSEEQREQVMVLCIAYHNLAVEQEYLKHLEAATTAYLEGARWALQFLGAGHQLTGILRSAVESLVPRLPPTSKVRARGEGSLEWSQAASRTASRIGSAARERPDEVRSADEITSQSGARHEALLTPRQQVDSQGEETATYATDADHENSRDADNENSQS